MVTILPVSKILYLPTAIFRNANTVWVQNFEGSIFRGFEESSLIRNFRGYKFSGIRSRSLRVTSTAGVVVGRRYWYNAIYAIDYTEGSATCNSCVRDFEIRRVYTKKISGFQKRFPDFRWDFRISQALAGISDYRQKISRDFWISVKILIACDF